jgi:Divergent InlB B-repeat domain
MNGTTKLMLMTMAAATAISGVKASSISLQEPAALSGNPIFSLTVENGKPSGHYEAGTQVVVSAAEAPRGSQFARWTGDIVILANPFLSSTTATIPFMAVAISASYTEPQTVATGTDETSASSKTAPTPAASSPPGADRSWGG